MVIRKLPRAAVWFLVSAAFILMIDTAGLHALAAAAEDRLYLYAMLFDLMVVIPLLYWLLVLRREGKSIAKLAPLPLLGALFAWVVFPASMRNIIWKTAGPLELLILAAEAVFIVYELRLLYHFFRQFRDISRHTSDTPEAMRLTMRGAFGESKLGAVLLHDLYMAYYLCFSWTRKQPSPPPDSESSFTYHRKTSQLLYTGIITIIVVFVSVLVHLLLQQWSAVAAWIFTVVDVWLIVLLWADARASVLNPLRLSSDTLIVRYGLRIQADIPLEYISSVTCAGELRPDATEMPRAVTPLLSTANIRIDLRRPIRVQSLLFLPREVTFIYLALDEPDTFANKYQDRLLGSSDSAPRTIDATYHA